MTSFHKVLLPCSLLLLIVSLILVSATTEQSLLPTSTVRRVMPWMCLERCGSSPAQIQSHLAQLKEHRSSLTAVSFEKYNLGPNSTLVSNNLTNVLPQLQLLQLETYPMISSYPYPPQFLDWMRELFANPQPFFQSTLEEGLRNSYTGYNVDFEPQGDPAPTKEDATAYANFLSEFAVELHVHGMKLTVDVASWSNLWNFTLLGESGADRVITMSTYTGSQPSWESALQQGVEQIGVAHLGVGLQTINTVNNQNYTDAELQTRFQAIEQDDVQEIDIWTMPIPDNWWPFIDAFAAQGG
mmetsp:Transcript_800/g.2504  ORF Transcript_800/g.2504 Transcript_800/m.2504 type:complete len:298 (-) Transcript_800:35-928(-)|eukprot:CAMPEP_0177640624 /NCGR_PEP_ID=MMETSP0447-20121125/6641_1 /TAXON_ID=0 /ORGANISM="Stygamoeba regulata, Strain BSH-02190019" /LENGTH=297 /DNA_ID=CAMNT_0019142705 /DNA_START=122 /DNA_END=1015 /DNA_ORIENTATION=-